MVIKNVVVKSKKVYVQTVNTEKGKVRTYLLGKSDVFTNVKITKEGFSATAVARDGHVGKMDIVIDKKGKMIGIVVDHPKANMKVISTKKEVMLHVKKK